MEGKYKIKVKGLEGEILYFTFDKYENIEGGFIKFIEKKEGKIKIFHSIHCEFVEVSNDGD